MSESISLALQPPVAVALAKLVKTFPGPDALPGVIYAEPKWDGYLHCTLSTLGKQEPILRVAFRAPSPGSFAGGSYGNQQAP